MTTLVLEQVTFEFDGPVRALDGVDLTIAPGEVVGVVGANGSGKTTLLQHLDGLLRPTSGRVLLDGRDAATMRVAELAAVVALGMADPSRQIFGRTVASEVAFGPRRLGRSKAEVDRLTAEALDAVGLGLDGEAHPGDLGGARRKLVVIASTIAMDTPVVALDEPTANLDARGRERARAAIAGLRTAGRTVVLAGHDLRFLASIADRVVRLERGRVVADGPVEAGSGRSRWAIIGMCPPRHPTAT